MNINRRDARETCPCGMSHSIEELKETGWKEMWEHPALSAANDAFIVQAIRSGSKGYDGPDFRLWFDEFVSKIYTAGKEAGRNETPASMRLHEKDCCKLWAGCDCVSCDCGKEARELRMARSNTTS